MIFNNIVIRKELKPNEFRTPIIPMDVNILIANGFNVFIEHSKNRCFSTEEYINNGAILISDDDIYKLDTNSTIILGLKELEQSNQEYFKFTHMYFSHTYKNQSGSKEILNLFKKNGGQIYDLEYITDNQNNRLVHFGYYAGFIGAFLGICQYVEKINNNNLVNLKPIFNINTNIIRIKNIVKLYNSLINIAIIGPNGRCGKGASDLLNLLDLPYDKFERRDDKNNLCNYNIIINCIFLKTTDQIEPFVDFDRITNFKNCIIVDVSCDFNNDNNPIKIYDKSTSHENPVIRINDCVDLIAIDNLPTLIPIESSKHFSNKLVELLININDKNNDVWLRCINEFYKKSQ